MPQSLHGLNLLVTRPQPQADHLCHDIQARGGHALRFPTLTIANPTDYSLLEERIKRLDTFDIAIFISQNAVNKSLAVIKRYWPSLPQHLAVAAIGPATAQALAQQKINVTLCPPHDYSSEGLLALDTLNEIHDKAILIIRGEGGRTTLADTLLKRGAKVQQAIAYRRLRPSGVKLPLPLLHIDFIISTSGESLDNLWYMLAAQHAVLSRLPLIVVSERMAEQAKQLGFTSAIHVTPQASHQGIMDCLINLDKITRHHNIEGKNNGKSKHT